MKSISNAAASQAMSLMIGYKPSANSRVAHRNEASRPIRKDTNHEHRLTQSDTPREVRIVSFTLPIDQQL
jgi:hypothetical protein